MEKSAIEIINEYTEYIEASNKENNGVIYVRNSDWQTAFDPPKNKFIIVGDNPGKTEKEENRYFIGASGITLKNFFKNRLGISEKEYIIFNKTPIHTAKTIELKSIEQSILECSMIKSAEIIASLSNSLKIPILIFGKGNINTIFKPFILTLKSSKCEYYLYNHPAYGNLSRECNAYIGKNQLSINGFYKLGEINRNKITKK